MKRYGVRVSARLSVCLSVPAWAHSSKPGAAGLLLAGDLDRLSQRANAGSAALLVYVGS